MQTGESNPGSSLFGSQICSHYAYPENNSMKHLSVRSTLDYLGRNGVEVLLVSFFAYVLIASNFALLRVVSTIYAGGYIAKIAMAFFVLGGGLCLVMNWKKIQVDWFVFLLVFCALFAASYGLTKDPSVRYYISHIFVAILMIIYYELGFSYVYEKDFLVKIVVAFSNTLIVVYIILVGAFWFMYYNGDARYLGLSCQYLLLPLACYLSRKKYALTALTILLILLSAKRGVYLGAGVIVLFHVFRSVKSLVAILLFLLVAGTVCALVVIFAAQYLVSLPLIGTVAAKLNLLTKISDGTHLSIATSGRSAELIAAASLLLENWRNLLFGLGYGWHFTWSSIYHPKSIIESNYVHISFVNYILQYGVIIGGILIFSVVKRPLLLIKALQEKRVPSDFWWLPLFLLGKLVTAQTTYLLSQDIVFWLLLGMVSRLLVGKHPEKNFDHTRLLQANSF